MVDIDKIERAAEAATPGPWKIVDNTPFVYALNSDESNNRFDLLVRPGYESGKRTSEEELMGISRHIASCDPQTILKLIAVVRAASAMIDLYDKLALVLPGSEPDALREALEALS